MLFTMSTVEAREKSSGRGWMEQLIKQILVSWEFMSLSSMSEIPQIPGVVTAHTTTFS
jgi:hypothetical protein